MQKHILILALICTTTLFAQTNTEVYLATVSSENNALTINDFTNISNNEGYDNQPFFVNDSTFLYARSRNDQTDVFAYEVNKENGTWLTNTKNGSEYSPQLIPNTKDFTAVRLDTTGLQRLYRYKFEIEPKTISNQPIAYYAFYNEDTILASILDGDELALIVYNLKEDKSYKLLKGSGRSIHKIPNAKAMSYTSTNEDGNNDIYQLDMETLESFFITQLPIGIHDYSWLNDSKIICGSGARLYQYDLFGNSDWKEIVNLSEKSIDNITRVVKSPDGKSLAIVAEKLSEEKPTTTKLAPKLENIAWIAGNWKGEAFGGITEENWSKPSGGSMMATFKLINDGEISFYEIEIIREVNNTLLLQLKHFNNDLKGWETKEETVDFPLIEITQNKVIFEGMSFEKVSNNEMNVYVGDF